MADNHEITQLLHRITDGDTEAEAELLARVYPDLKRIAAKHLRREKTGHKFQVTELVNEAYVRIFGSSTPVLWKDRVHFFAVVAQQVRFILVDQARKRRSGDHLSVALDEAEYDQASADAPEITALDDALQELERIDPRAARVVVFRYFGGLTLEEVASALSKDISTVKRDWTFAKSWLYDQLRNSSADDAVS